MKTLLQYFLFTVALFGIGFNSFADIGETYQLKEKRKQLVQRLAEIEAPDTTKDNKGVGIVLDKLGESWEIRRKIIELDEKIFASYDETVSRISAQKSQRATNDRMLVALSIVTVVIAILLGILLFMARGRVMQNGESGLGAMYKALTSDLIKKTSPEKSGQPALLRVNLVVVIGLVVMSFSILSYLLGKL